MVKSNAQVKDALFILSMATNSLDIRKGAIKPLNNSYSRGTSPLADTATKINK